MGCDIHPVVVVENEYGELGFVWDRNYWDEKRWSETLPLLPSWLPDKERAAKALAALDARNYDAFAVLGDVRNGYGFAGIDTGEGFIPIQASRGLPEDFEELVDEDMHFGLSDPSSESVYNRSGTWLGDHSHGWVSLRELLEYPHWEAKRLHTGVVSALEYEEWDKVSCPKSYSGGIGGPGIRVYRSAEAYEAAKAAGETEPPTSKWPNARDYVQVKWYETVKESVGGLYTKVIPWLQTLGEPDKVRVVFGFDS